MPAAGDLPGGFAALFGALGMAERRDRMPSHIDRSAVASWRGLEASNTP
jgi:hypothetical protein